MEAARGRFPLWLCSYVALWLCSSVAMWLYGCVAVWLCGYLAMWLYGYMAMWLRGYVVLWLYGKEVHCLLLESDTNASTIEAAISIRNKNAFSEWRHMFSLHVFVKKIAGSGWLSG